MPSLGPSTDEKQGSDGYRDHEGREAEDERSRSDREAGEHSLKNSILEGKFRSVHGEDEKPKPVVSVAYDKGRFLHEPFLRIGDREADRSVPPELAVLQVLQEGGVWMVAAD